MNMFKRYTYILLSLILFSSTFIVPVTAYTEDTVYLSLDFENTNNLPRNFRKTTDLSVLKGSTLNLKGLDTLNISGSSEFAAIPLKLMLSNINKPHITVIDLRQESHGFINGNAVSWLGPGDKANKGLSFDEVLVKEQSQLNNIILNKPLQLDQGKYTITPTTVEDEKTLTKNNNINYLRLTVTDGERPSDDMVDRFMAYTKNISTDEWLHFHCKEGIGRTTTFMSMYDMIANSKTVSFNDIITRQLTLGQITDLGFYKPDQRTTFLNNFYNYTKENNDNFKTTWSDYIKTNNILPYTGSFSSLNINLGAIFFVLILLILSYFVTIGSVSHNMILTT